MVTSLRECSPNPPTTQSTHISIMQRRLCYYFHWHDDEMNEFRAEKTNLVNLDVNLFVSWRCMIQQSTVGRRLVFFPRGFTDGTMEFCAMDFCTPDDSSSMAWWRMTSSRVCGARFKHPCHMPLTIMHWLNVRDGYLQLVGSSRMISPNESVFWSWSGRSWSG